MSVDLLHGSESKRGSRMLRGILQKTIKRAALALTVYVSWCVCVVSVRSVSVLVCVSNALPCAWVKLENFILQSQYLPGSRGST